MIHRRRDDVAGEGDRECGGPSVLGSRLGDDYARGMSDGVEARLHAEMTPPFAHEHLVTSGVGPGGELVALWTDASGIGALRRRVTEPNGVSYPALSAERAVPCTATVRDRGRVRATALGVGLANDVVQPLPGGRLLVAGVRCRLTERGPTPNAAVYDDAGRQVAEGVLGDGINHLLTTGSGDIWVGYFDEGVFGNFGWGVGTKPLGASGIARFDDALEQVWTYPGGTHAPPVDDCYALNVTDTQVWACYYSDFPVARITGDHVRTWTNDVGAASAIVAEDTRVALFGGYREHRDRLVLGTVTGDHFEPQLATRLTLPDGAPVPRIRPVARGDELHLVDGNRWWKVSLDQIGRR